MESAATVCLTMTVFPLLTVEWGRNNRCMWHVGNATWSLFLPVGATGCVLNTHVLILFLTKMDPPRCPDHFSNIGNNNCDQTTFSSITTAGFVPSITFKKTCTATVLPPAVQEGLTCNPTESWPLYQDSSWTQTRI